MVEEAASDAERARVTELMNSIRPLSARVRGIEVDSRSEILPWPLERIAVPTLIVSAEDDLYNTLPGARFTAEQIRGAELRVLTVWRPPDGGAGRRVRGWIDDFLKRNQAKISLVRTTAKRVARPKAETRLAGTTAMFAKNF